MAPSNNILFGNRKVQPVKVLEVLVFILCSASVLHGHYAVYSGYCILNYEHLRLIGLWPQLTKMW